MHISASESNSHDDSYAAREASCATPAKDTKQNCRIDNLRPMYAIKRNIGRRLYRSLHFELFPYDTFGVFLETDAIVSFAGTQFATTRLSGGTIHLTPLHLAKLFPCPCFAHRSSRGVFKVRWRECPKNSA